MMRKVIVVGDPPGRIPSASPPGFCSIPDAAFSTDPRLSTLIHEVTHFDDTFSSKDTVGTMRKSLPLASNPEEARFNADSITGYVLYVD